MSNSNQNIDDQLADFHGNAKLRDIILDGTSRLSGQLMIIPEGPDGRLTRHGIFAPHQSDRRFALWRSRIRTVLGIRSEIMVGGLSSQFPLPALRLGSCLRMVTQSMATSARCVVSSRK